MTWVTGTGLRRADGQGGVDTIPSTTSSLRKRIRAGDHDAFGELFDARARSVYL